MVARHGFNLAKIDTKRNFEAFEHLCFRVVGGCTPLTSVVIYRPGSEYVSGRFFQRLHSVARVTRFVHGQNNYSWRYRHTFGAPGRPELSNLTFAHQLISRGASRQGPHSCSGGPLDAVIASEDCALEDVRVD